MPARVFFGLRLFERLQDLVSDRHGICKTLQSRRELFELVVAEVTVSNAGRQDEVIVWETNPFAICVAHEDILLILVHSGDFSENGGGGLSQSPAVGQPAEPAADDHDSWLWHDLSHPTRSAVSERD